MALTGVAPDGGSVFVTAAAVSLFYTGGMFLNDAFDHQFDRKFRPERPIPTGEISPAAVYVIGFGLLVTGLFFVIARDLFAASVLDMELLGWSALLVVVIIYYDYRHKVDPLSPIVMSLCRLLVYCVAAASVSSAMSVSVVVGALTLALYMIGLTYAAKQENLAEFKNLWPLLLLAAPFFYGLPILQRSSQGVVAYLLLTATVVVALRWLASKRNRNIQRAVVTLIAGISLVDAIMVAGGAATLGAWAWFCIAAFDATLAFQRFIPGT
jgi:4-hydroxybenzoate polyprenyltransferase